VVLTAWLWKYGVRSSPIFSKEERQDGGVTKAKPQEGRHWLKVDKQTEVTDQEVQRQTLVCENTGHVECPYESPIGVCWGSNQKSIRSCLTPGQARSRSPRCEEQQQGSLKTPLEVPSWPEVRIFLTTVTEIREVDRFTFIESKMVLNQKTLQRREKTSHEVGDGICNEKKGVQNRHKCRRGRLWRYRQPT
jgi:hypothetical protein